MMNNFQIAIDGPAGSGKSTIASMVAKKIGFKHIDTGAMYRAITYEALRRNIDLDNEDNYNFIDDLKLSYENDKMFLNGIDISLNIRSLEVTNNVSKVAQLAFVRSKMLPLQREIASNGYIVMDGRDIGSNVLKNANLKIFLTASIDVRAKRRSKENSNISFEDIKSEMIKRDHMDENRKISPLKRANDSYLIDTTNMDINEVLNRIIDLIHERKK